MMKKFVVVLSAVMLMAVPALGLAAMAGSNTVNSAAIVDGAVATVDIANKAVTAAKIADATITATQLANGAVTAAKLGIVCTTGQTLSYTSTGWACSAGTPGPTGPQGPQGIQGPAGTGVKYAEVVVVAKSGGDYTNPMNAIASIKDASAAKPYLVKVMAGVYDLGTASLVMKPYVYLEGSGDSSVITSAAVNTNGHCVNGTIVMANNSIVKNIRVINSGTGNTAGVASAVVFNNVSTTFESSSVLAGSPTNNSSHVYAICSEGASANAIINNVTVEAYAGDSGNPSAVGLILDSTMVVTNSKLIAENFGMSHLHVIDCHCIDTDDEFSNASFFMDNSYVEGKTPDWNALYYGNACKTATISNSKLVARDSIGTNVVETNRETKIINTQIYSTGVDNPVQLLFDANLNNWMKVATSNLQVTIPNPANIKLFNNFDMDFNPIANQ